MGSTEAFPSRNSTPKRRRIQFSLKSLWVLMTAAGMIMGRITYLRKLANSHKAETEMLQKHRQFL
jgi:hypothetical protein